ncbi:hypothetical protein KKF64_03250 [Patescibacteria group bacterium]|nr:hypothetical protein [Patescibacteria group bacterium]
MVIQQYQDPSVSRWLKIGFWYQAHKSIVIKSIIGTLIGINVIFWASTFYGAVKYISSLKHEQALYSGLVLNRIPVFQIHELQSPADIIISDINIVPSAGEKSSIESNAKIVDLIAIVENPNPNWSVKVDYFFRFESKETAKTQVQILPEQKAPLLGLGLNLSSSLSDPELEIQIQWQRIKDFDNLQRAISAQENISVSSTKFLPKNGITDVNISIENKGAHSLRGADLIIALSRPGRTPSAVGIYTAEKIPIEENLEINMRWLHLLPAGLQANVYPLLDFLDNSAYILPEGRLDFKL